MSRRRVWLDTNVTLDLILERDPFVEDVATIFSLHEALEIEIYISTLSLANIAYVVKKNGRNPFLVVATLLKWVNIISLDVTHFEKNLATNFKDFEDGLQYFSAMSVKDVKCIITRDKVDFKSSAIPVFTPKEFLKTIAL